MDRRRRTTLGGTTSLLDTECLQWIRAPVDLHHEVSLTNSLVAYWLVIGVVMITILWWWSFQ